MVAVAADRFEMFGTQHLAALAVSVIGVLVAMWIGMRVRNTPAARRDSRVFAVAICAVTIPIQIIQFLPAEWNIRTSLPFHLCDLAWVFAVHALWTHSRLSATVTYLWGILTLVAMVTPDLASPWPEPRFIMFWALHILIVWAAAYLVLGLHIWPTWSTYRRTIVITLAWAVSVFVFNTIADTNYGFLNDKPSGGSILDHFGPWPYYVFVQIVLVAAGWALFTWPFTRREVKDTVVS